MPQNIQQREELHKTIWAIANSLRGAIDGWEFKSYVLCSIFYRFISENMQHYIDHLQELAGVKGFDYSQLDDQAAFEEQKNTAGGKKTWKSYLWKVCGDEYDQAHGA